MPKVYVKGGGEVTLTKADFLAAGGGLFDITARHDLCFGYATNGKTSNKTRQDLSQLWGHVSQHGGNRRQGAASLSQEVLPNMQTLWGSLPNAVARQKGDEPKQSMPQLWATIQVWREIQQCGASERGVQYLPGCGPCPHPEATSDHLQRWCLPALWLQQDPQCPLFPPHRSSRKTRHHLQAVHRCLGTASSGTRQVRNALPELPCRASRGGMA